MRAIRDALIMPLEGMMDAFTGGVFDSGGEFIADSVIHRGRAPVRRDHGAYLQGTHIYGGCLFAYFGHFIWESLARIATIRKCRPYPLLFITPNDHLFNTQKLFFRAMGIRNEIVLVRKPTLVENLIYAPPLSSLSPVSMSGEMLDALAFRDSREMIDRKVWLSRTKLKYGRIINERDIVERISEFGFEIVSPERLSLHDQVRLISTSRVVAGFSGSQFFSSFFARRILGEFRIFNRRPRVPDTIPFMLENKKINCGLTVLEVEEAVKGDPEKNMVALQPDRIVEVLSECA